MVSTNSYGKNGIRNKKVVGSTQIEYLTDESGKLIGQKTGIAVMYFMYDSDNEIIGFTYKVSPTDSLQTYYYVKNAQGDIVAITNDQGYLIAKYEYNAWSKLISVKNENGTIITDNANIAILNPIRYRGYYYDNESGLYYLNSRYYDPNTGRFINADGLVSTGQGVLGHNMFAYCGNNPIMLTDINGMRPILSTSTANETKAERQLSLTYMNNLNRRSSFPKELSINDFKNSDGSYSLYDNKRHNPNSVFHEQILSAKVTKPSASLKNGELTLGSYKATLITGGWEWKYVDLSLLNFGSAKVAAGIHEHKLEATAMATIWDPSITFKVSGVKISLTVNIGSLGGDFNVGTKSFKAAAACGWGAGLSIDWE